MIFYFSKQSEKYLHALPRTVSLKLLEKIEKIPKGDIKRLAGRTDEYRLRFGKFRVLFYIESDTVKVFKIDSRGDVYKN